MNAQNEIQFRMEKIKEIFLSAQTIATKENDFDLLSFQLDKTENEFRSVAYEAASMEIALRDFTKNNSLENWKIFANKFQQHQSQIHVGLGWAIAQQRLSVLPFLEFVNPDMRMRVLDGIGYYNGIFRLRNTILNKNAPEEIVGNLLLGFDEGVGRSLWYNAEGNVTKVAGLVNEFALNRQQDLWRGISIACVYVGGINQEILKDILLYSKHYSLALSLGVAMVAQSRLKSVTITSDVELACKVWCNYSVTEAVELANKFEVDFNSITKQD